MSDRCRPLRVDAMVAGGSTNQTIGLVWGWHAMSQGNPMNPPALPSNTSRYIIILSDGLNTQDRWYGDGSNHRKENGLIVRDMQESTRWVIDIESLEQLMDLDVTSVSKQSEPFGQAPAAIQVVTGDEIRRAGASSIPEALRLAPHDATL